MKSPRMFFVVLLIALLAAACAPTAPKGSGDATWDRIQSTGKIVIGTSADYKPFEYYDANNNNTMDGFDVAIARDLGTRLGLQVELKDYAFEGLPAALQVTDIDAAIAAISVTSEREATTDFSDVYYSEQDGVLARQGSGVKVTTPQQLTTYRVGVQRGTTYAAWMKKTLVDPGLMPATNMLEYAKPDDAVRDLKENRNDLVLLGLTPAKDYVTAGGVELAGQSLNSQIYAIAMPKGASVLKDNINKALTSMRNDGTLAKYSDYYLHVDYSQQPPVGPTPVPAPVPTTAPGAPAACYDSMQYISDVTIPDWTVMQPGQQFNKTWRIKNNGTCAWDSSYRLVYVQGYAMNGAPAVIQGVVNPGSKYDVTVGFTAPTDPGDYQSWWQMVNGQNIAFGIRIWVAITVPGEAEPTATAVPAQPTATAAPTQPQPTAAPTEPAPTATETLTISNPIATPPTVTPTATP
jgi:ABC-type amino acid transport substrate-binding protein